MRDTDPVHKTYVGDPAVGQTYLGAARVLLGRMLNYLNGNTGSKRWDLEDGTVITTSALGSVNKIEIDVTASGGCQPLYNNPIKGIIAAPYNTAHPNSFLREATVHDPARGGAVALDYPKTKFYSKDVNFYDAPATYYRDQVIDTCGHKGPWYDSLKAGTQYWTDGFDYLSFMGPSLRYFGEFNPSTGVDPGAPDYRAHDQIHDVGVRGLYFAGKAVYYVDPATKTKIFLHDVTGGALIKIAPDSKVAECKIVFVVQNTSKTEKLYVARFNKRNSVCSTPVLLGSLAYTDISSDIISDVDSVVGQYVGFGQTLPHDVDLILGFYGKAYTAFMQGVWCFSHSGLDAVAVRPNGLYVGRASIILTANPDVAGGYTCVSAIIDAGAESITYTTGSVLDVSEYEFSESPPDPVFRDPDNVVHHSVGTDTGTDKIDYSYEMPVYDYDGSGPIGRSVQCEGAFHNRANSTLSNILDSNRNSLTISGVYLNWVHDWELTATYDAEQTTNARVVIDGIVMGDYSTILPHTRSASLSSHFTVTGGVPGSSSGSFSMDYSHSTSRQNFTTTLFALDIRYGAKVTFTTDFTGGGNVSASGSVGGAISYVDFEDVILGTFGDTVAVIGTDNLHIDKTAAASATPLSTSYTLDYGTSAVSNSLTDVFNPYMPPTLDMGPTSGDTTNTQTVAGALDLIRLGQGAACFKCSILPGQFFVSPDLANVQSPMPFFVEVDVNGATVNWTTFGKPVIDLYDGPNLSTATGMPTGPGFERGPLSVV